MDGCFTSIVPERTEPISVELTFALSESEPVPMETLFVQSFENRIHHLMNVDIFIHSDDK